MTTKEFIEKANSIHNGKYDYSNVNYINPNTKICIICPEHGEFWQTPKNHLNGRGCSKCSGKYKWKTNEWVDQCVKIFGNKYNYSKVNYVNSTTKVCIICPEHGEFWMIPTAHMYQKQGCPICGKTESGVKRRKNIDLFIEQSNKIHCNKYDYSKVEYENTDKKVCIICPEHGEFWQTPHNHISISKPQGCPMCSLIKNTQKRTKTQDEFISECVEKYGDKFGYDKVEYLNSYTNVTIKCKKHGYFSIRPYNFLNMHGCPKCRASIMELKCISYFEKNNIDYEMEKHFSWLFYNGRMRLDFYLPQYNIGIECQGIQHYTHRVKFGDTEEFNKIKERDKIKLTLCISHNIPIEYIKYDENIESKLNKIIKKYNIYK